MATPRIVWRNYLDRETEKPVLEQLYVQYGVATDQLRRAPGVLTSITETFNKLTDRQEAPGILLRYMVNRRKNDGGDWPKLGDKAEKFESVTNLLTSAEMEALREIYVSSDMTSDELLFSPKYGAKIAESFKQATGRILPSSILIAIVFAKRKRGLWPTIRTTTEAAPFADIGQVARQFRTGS